MSTNVRARTRIQEGHSWAPGCEFKRVVAREGRAICCLVHVMFGKGDQVWDPRGMASIRLTIPFELGLLLPEMAQISDIAILISFLEFDEVVVIL